MSATTHPSGYRNVQEADETRLSNSVSEEHSFVSVEINQRTCHTVSPLSRYYRHCCSSHSLAENAILHAKCWALPTHYCHLQLSPQPLLLWSLSLISSSSSSFFPFPALFFLVLIQSGVWFQRVKSKKKVKIKAGVTIDLESHRSWK